MTPTATDGQIWGLVEWAIALAWTAGMFVFGFVLRVGYRVGVFQTRLDAVEAHAQTLEEGARRKDAEIAALREHGHAVEKQLVALPEEISRRLEPQFEAMRGRIDRAFGPRK